MTWPLRLALALALLLARSGSAGAQSTGEVRLEAGTATALPAAEVEGDAAIYGLTGLSIDWTGGRVAVAASLYGGLALDDARGGDFATARIRGEAWTGGPSGAALGLVGRAYGFAVSAPFPYRNVSLLGGPAARWGGGVGRAELRIEGGSGASVVELRRSTDSPVRRIEEHLWTFGGVLDAGRDLGSVRISATTGVWRSAGGPFRSLGIAVTRGGARVAARGELGVWDTPIGSEWVGGVALVAALGGRWSVQAVGERAAPDPLTLVEAGGQGGATVGWAVTRFEAPAEAPLWEAVAAKDGRSRVRFRLERPGAARVEITGDFTGWEARAMRREGEIWTLELEVPAGTHHFGFLVDGEWHVPEGHPGNVPDEWGRTNATVVVGPASREVGP